MSAKYSDERLEEILSEFRDDSAPERESKPETPVQEKTEDIPVDTSESQPPEEDADKVAAKAAEEETAEARFKFKLNIDKQKLAGFFADEGFSVASCVIAAAAFILFVFSWALPTTGALRSLCFIVPYLLAGYKTIYSAVQALRGGEWLDDSLIISITSIVAICLGLVRDAAALMILFAALRLLSAYVEIRSEKALSELSAIRPDCARAERGSVEEKLPAEEVLVGECILVDPGEIIPLDGEIVEGMTDLDLAALTGCSLPKTVTVGNKVFAGSFNISSPLKVRVTAAYPDTVASRMLSYVNLAAGKKSLLEKKLDKAKKIFKPAMLALALLTVLLPSVISGNWLTWIARALVFLALSSVGALSMSIALAYFGGIGRSAGRGLIIKGDSILEAIAHLDTVVFNKTGTITDGRFEVIEVFPRNMSERELLDIAATAECCSKHPIARCLREAGRVIISPEDKLFSTEEIPGRGISAFIGGKQVYVGNAALLEERGIVFSFPSRPGTAIHVAVDGEYAGHIMIKDRIRKGAVDALEQLRAEGAKTLVMLTGDVHSAAKPVAISLNFDMVKSELNPAGKVSAIEYMLCRKNSGSCIAFVGDGVGDKEALGRADIGIAMAALGLDEAIDSADAVLLGDDLKTLPIAARICRLASGIIRQNMIIAAAVKLCALLLGVFGVIPLWIAALMDSAASAAVIVNSLRTFNKNEKE